MNLAQAIGIIKPQGNTGDHLKAAYRAACKKYHPDVAGPASTEMMKLVNLAYAFLREHLGKWNIHRHADTSGAPSIDDIFMDILSKLRGLSGLYFEVCGTWLWVSGETKRHKDKLHAAGLRYAPNKERWYWRPADYKKHGKRSFSMEEIRATFGSQRIDPEEEERARAYGRA